MSEREAILLEAAEPDKSLLSVIPQLVDPITGKYALPAHSFFEGVARIHREGITGLGEIVAIVDTGIDHSHPLLSGAILNAKDFSKDGTTQDLNGHGTIVALIIRYVAPNTNILNAKALGKNGRGSEQSLAAAMDWARKQNATVVNISAGIPEVDPLTTYPTFLRKYFSNKLRTHWIVYSLRRHWSQRCKVCEAADRLIRAGINVCTAVGNQKGIVTCPGRGKKRAILVVGAANITSGKPVVTPYSSLWPDLVAPELPLAEGTSFSSPFVAGSLCLLRETIDTKGPQVGLAKLMYIINRGNFLFDAGYFKDAIVLYLRALNRDSHTAKHKANKKKVENCLYCRIYTYPVRNRLGLAYLQTGQFTLAQEQFIENVKITPNFPDSHMNLGASYRCNNSFEDAIREYHQALMLDKNKAEAYDGLADTYALQGEFNLAISTFEQSIQKNPLRAYPYERLSNLCKHQGFSEKAQAYLNALASISIENSNKVQ